MVWEQGVVVIVNLTKLSDLGLVSAVYNMDKKFQSTYNLVILVFYLSL